MYIELCDNVFKMYLTNIIEICLGQCYMRLLSCIFASIIMDQKQKSSWDGFYFVTVSGVTVSLHKPYGGSKYASSSNCSVTINVNTLFTPIL